MGRFRDGIVGIALLGGAILPLVAFAAPGATAAGAMFEVGYADVDITPPLGHTMPGYFRERRADGVLDPLLAKALVLKNGETALVFAALDLIGVKAGQVADIRGAVTRETGIPGGHVFVHATHTHTGVTVSEVMDRLPGQVAEAVKKSLDATAPESRVRYGSSAEDSIAFIRRYLMDDGTVRTNPGRGNPAVVRPIGGIDPSVDAVAFEDAKVMLVCYGLHLDCIGGTKFSADYPYHMTEAIREALGDGWNVVFLNRCSGNVNHIDVNNPGQGGGYEESRRIGRKLAEAALEARDGARPIEIDVLAAKTETVQSPVRKVPDELYRWAKMQMETNADEASKRNFNEPSPARIVALAESADREHPSEVIVFRAGPLGIAGLPAEVFVEIGRDIQTHSLLPHTWPVGLTGGAMGYQPHPRGYREGGYEATYASARYAPENADLWTDTAIRLLNGLYAVPGGPDGQ